MSEAGRRTVAQLIADHLVAMSQVAVDHSIHAPGQDGDEKNWHCHLMFTTRRMTAKGLGDKTREWDERDRAGSNEPNLARRLRAFVAATMNAELAKEGKSGFVHVQHETYKARGSSRKAQQHQGPQKTHSLRKQQGMARAAWQREQRAAMAVRHERETAALKARHELTWRSKLDLFAERQRTGEADIKRELDQQREADRTPQKTGIRGAFRNLTGRAGREAFEMQTRDGQRVEMAQQKLEALRTGIAAERREFAATQQQERGALNDSHKQDMGKIQSAMEARQQIDRGAERAARQPQEQTRQQDRQHERGRSMGRDFTR